MTNNIVWIDLETGGFNSAKIKLPEPILMPNGKKIESISGSQYYPILEIGIIITDNNLNIIDQYQSEIRQSRLALKNMNEWCIEQHGKTGLMKRSLESDKSIERVEAECLSFLSKNGFSEKTPMAGSSIHFDHDFISQQMEKLSAKFTHQHIDVTSLHNFYKVKYPDLANKVRELKSNVSHLVIDDIKDSIEIAKIYSLITDREELSLEDLLKNKNKNKNNKPM